MKYKLTAYMVIVMAIVFASCVSSKKYKTAQKESQNLQAQLSTCDNNLKSSEAKITDLNNQVTSLKNQNAALSVDAKKYQDMKAEAQMKEAKLNAALAEQGTSMKEIQEKLITGLGQLMDSGMTVTYKEGLLHITLPEKMVFPARKCNFKQKCQSGIISFGFHFESVS